MDEPDADPAALRESLAYIRKINRVMGYIRVVLRQLERFSVNWERGRTIRILDVATGSADIPLAILRWADRRGLNVSVVGVDLNAVIVREAEAAAARMIRGCRSSAATHWSFHLPTIPASITP